MTDWSRAFQRETMQSEQVRIVGILAVLGAAFLIIVTRAIIVRGDNEYRTVLTFATLLGVMAAYETAMLVIVRRTARDDRSLPAWSWIINVVIESLLPTVALLILTENPAFGPYRALVAPALLSYFFFITLSTLRLSPALARATGISSAVGYTIVVIYTIVRYPTPPIGALPLGQGIYLTYAALLLIGGWIAGEVARQIRKHVTTALEEAIQRDRFHRDLEVARSIQQALLPTNPPQIPGFDIAGWNQPADQTGGDFYFWESLGGGKTAITVADVTGHGIGPAIIASVSRAYGRACVLPDSEMGAAMTRIDELLCEDLPSGKLVNYILAVLDSEGAKLQLLSAGQGPLLIYRAASATIESFKAHGVPLGVGLGLGYGPAQDVVLDPGDLLVLMTDGFFEWENRDGEQFGLNRLNATIEQAGGLPAKEIISTLYAAVLEFANGAEQQDDLTVVIVKRKSSE